MEPKFQNSFIPKKPTVTFSQPSEITTVKSSNIFSFSATFIFVVALLSLGGLFGYKILLNNQIKAQIQQMTNDQASFDKKQTQELIDIDNKMNSTETLLRDHAIASRVLILMNDIIGKKLKFSSFEYTNDQNKISINIKGESQTYNALADEQTSFSKSAFLTNSKFSNINLSESGNIGVDISAVINPDLVSFDKLANSLP